MVVHVCAHQGLFFVHFNQQGLGPGLRNGRHLLRFKADHHLHHIDEDAEVDVEGALVYAAFELWRNRGPECRDIEAAERENHLQHACAWFGYSSHHVCEDRRVEGGRGGVGAPKHVDGRYSALDPSPYISPCIVLHGHILRHGGEILRGRRNYLRRPGSPGLFICPWWKRHALLLLELWLGLVRDVLLLLGLLGLFLLSWLVMLLLLQLLLMFDTVEALHNRLKHGCDTRGNLAMHHLFRRQHLLRRLGRGL